MYLIHEQYVVWFKIGQQRSQITLFFQHRPGAVTQVGAHLVGNDVGQRGFPQPGRPKNEHVIQRFFSASRRLNENLHLFRDLGLPHVVRQRFRADGTVQSLVFR